MEHLRCKTCRFWDENHRECHRMPPVPEWRDNMNDWSFPHVTGGSWCGQHESIEYAPTDLALDGVEKENNEIH